MSEFAVKIENGSKAIDGQIVLKNLNMKVKKNSIYSLFGSSGCGKTTLLKIIAGFLRLDSGEIFVAPTKKFFGFLPQNFSLFVDLTILENLKFFSKIYGMKSEKFEERSKNLLKFFELSEEKFEQSLVSKLSGGEKQRASLIVALLHQPKLLILDEPTANLDVVLRRKVFEFLKFYCAHNEATIIFTSHCMSEIFKSETVAFLRNGKLLCEDSPVNLMKSLDVKALDEVFYKLSKFKDEEREKVSAIEIQQYNEKVDENFSMKNFRALLMKNFLLMKRNLNFNIYNFFFPFFTIMTFVFCYGRLGQNVLITVESSSNFNESFVSDQKLENFETIRRCFSEFLDFDGKFLVDNKNSTSNCFNLLTKAKTICNQNFDDFELSIEFLETKEYTKILHSREIREKFEQFMMKIQKFCGFNPISIRIPIAIENLTFAAKKFLLNVSGLPAYIYIVHVCVAMYSSKKFVDLEVKTSAPI